MRLRLWCRGDVGQRTPAGRSHQGLDGGCGEDYCPNRVHYPPQSRRSYGGNYSVAGVRASSVCGGLRGSRRGRCSAKDTRWAVAVLLAASGPGLSHSSQAASRDMRPGEQAHAVHPEATHVARSEVSPHRPKAATRPATTLPGHHSPSGTHGPRHPRPPLTPTTTASTTHRRKQLIEQPPRSGVLFSP